MFAHFRGDWAYAEPNFFERYPKKFFFQNLHFGPIRWVPRRFFKIWIFYRRTLHFNSGFLSHFESGPVPTHGLWNIELLYFAATEMGSVQDSGLINRPVLPTGRLFSHINKNGPNKKWIGRTNFGYFLQKGPTMGSKLLAIGKSRKYFTFPTDKD
jgi:hypothetical protein